MLNFDNIQQLVSMGVISPQTARYLADTIKARTLHLSQPSDEINPNNPSTGFSVQQAGAIVNGFGLPSTQYPQTPTSPDLQIPVANKLLG